MSNLDGDMSEALRETAPGSVSRVQFHTGVQIGNRVHNSLDAIKNQVDMRMCHHGVHIVTAAGDQYIVGMPDILWVKLG